MAGPNRGGRPDVLPFPSVSEVAPLRAENIESSNRQHQGVLEAPDQARWTLKGNQIAAAAQVLQPYVAKQAPRTPAWRGFLQHSTNHVAAWMDQAVVSATSF